MGRIEEKKTVMGNTYFQIIDDPNEKCYTKSDMENAFNAFRYVPFPHNEPTFEEWIKIKYPR